MCEPFISNHQFNYMKKQAVTLEQALRTNADPKVVESVRYSAITRIAELFPDAAPQQMQKLEAIFKLQSADDISRQLKALEPDRTAFPPITAKQIQKLFPKNKKLKLPDLETIDFRHITYLSWVDIATNKLFIVYPAGGQFVGVEGKFTPTNKKSFCFVCNRYEELALFTAVTKKRPAHASPDYYKAVGNYLCMNGQECNKNITDTAALERFIDAVIG
ncbi:FusB/FusC family EF-G-binding protein [Paenibacillus whitsoniae]|uniref:Elongation factor G-binding protein n=1 Tax=Paenibacillus whitsoniae TaxID=2496558 RepID=A0A3S0ABX5_9BACL|nr:FusB/FusC family EF-G-binding protein [Paenibacillus whitsoniae]RTE09416.1 elongation factor G-binding protein [Paenibacillus whitsoniae]